MEVIDVVIFAVNTLLLSGPGELVPDLPGSPIPSAGEIVPIVVVSFFPRKEFLGGIEFVFVLTIGID